MEYIGQFYYLFTVGLGFLHTCRSFPVDPKDTEVAVYNVISHSWPVIVSLSIIFLIASVVLLAGCLCCRGTNGFKTEEGVVKEEIKEFRNSASSTNLTGVGIGYVNSNLSGSHDSSNELAIFPPPGVNATTTVTFEPLPNIVPPLQQQQVTRNKPPSFNTSPSQDFSIADWFVKEANFPREQLHYLRECGRGWFGRVVEGEARNVGEGGRNCKVVVRILRDDATPSEQKFFLNEAKSFRDLSHPNILKLVGRCLDTEPYLVLLESCSSGDLKSFLCGNVASRSALCEQGICLRMMCDVAAGLQHMHENGFVHTDLAARNCLVTSDLIVKVGDYGTSIDTYKDDYYVAGDMAIPIRWCSPESLHCTDTTIETKEVTALANVWSFSILLWEVCEFGALPYTSLSDEQVIVRVLGKEGLKLPPPTYPSLHSQHLYSLMQMCWRDEKERATLDHVIAMLRHLQVTRTLDSDDNFERRWDTLKPNTIPVTDNQKLDAITLKSDFDSGVDLDAKSADLDLSKRKSSVDISPSTTSPQLSVASSSGGDFFTPLSKLKRQLSPSLTNLKGSLEDIPIQIVSSAEQSPQHLRSDTEQFDSWLKGVETTNEEDVKFVKKISEAIRDLDDALALEKTSSSSEASSKHGSPIKEPITSEQNPILDFRLGFISSTPQLDSFQDDHLGHRQDSSSDTEEETWRGRVERGEFSEKVKEKSRSVADLMILTHIDNSEGSDESDSLPSLTRQFSIEKSRRLGLNRNNTLSTTMTSIGFGSEGNIRGAVLGEEFQESLKQLQNAWKIRDAESRNASLTFEDINRIPSHQTTKPESQGVTFLGDEASEKEIDNANKNNVKFLVDNLYVENVNNFLTSHSVREIKLENEDRCLGSSNVDSDVINDLVLKDQNVINEFKEQKENLNYSGNLLPDVSLETKHEIINKESSDIVKRPPDLPEVSLETKHEIINKESPDIVKRLPDLPEVSLETKHEIINKESSDIVKRPPDLPEVSLETKHEIINKESSDIVKRPPDLPEVSLETKHEIINKESSDIVKRPPDLPEVSLETKHEIINKESPDIVKRLPDLPEVSLETKHEIINKESSDIEKRPDLNLSDSILVESISKSTIDSKSQIMPKECVESIVQFLKFESLHSGNLLKKDLIPEISLNDNMIKEDTLLNHNTFKNTSNILSENNIVDISEQLDSKKEEFLLNSSTVEDNDLNLKMLERIDNLFSETDVIKNSVTEDINLKNITKDSDVSVIPISPTSKEVIDEPLLEKDILILSNDSSNISVHDFINDSKETSISELESSSQSSEQVTTVVENDLTKLEENIEDLILQPSDTMKNIPQIVVTEVNELEMDNDPDNESLCHNVEYLPRKFRILISDDTDTDDDDGDGEDNDDSFDDENDNLFNKLEQQTIEDISSTLPPLNQLKRGAENEGNFLEDFEISDIDLRKSFDSNSINIYNFKEKNCDIDKLKLSNIEQKHESDTMSELNEINMSPVNNNSGSDAIDVNQYSVILGSCEDYTLDYFKGLKTTNGKQLNCNDTLYTKDESNQNEESEVEDTGERDDNINNWDRFLTNSLAERIVNEDSFRNVQFDHNHPHHLGLDSLSSSQTDMTSEDTVIEDQNEDEVSERLNKINLDLSEQNNNIHSDNEIINNDYPTEEDMFISDNNMDRKFNMYDAYSNQDKDIQMIEVKTRLENVAKFPVGFKLKSEGTGEEEEEEEGKLLTPDDERSSDSGFRDKGSLSESVEDACDEKYNLEDIEAELEEAYSKKESKYFGLQDEISSSSGEFCAQSSFPSNNYTLQCSSDNLTDLEEPLGSDYRKDNENESDNEKGVSGLESEEVQCLTTSFNEPERETQSGGWFLHPPSSETLSETTSSGWYPVPVAQEESNRDDTSYVSFHLDEEFVTAIRNELQEKLPCAQQQSVSRKDGEEDMASPEEERADMVIEYGNYPVPLSPILEERESVSSNQSSIILDLQDSVEASGKSSPVLHLERRDNTNESMKNFEEEIKVALNFCKTDSLESEEAAIVVEDLEDKKQLKVREEPQQEEFDDLLIVDTETNEAKLLESPRPKSHLAFVGGQKIMDKFEFPETSPSINTDTFTPDSISPVSSRSSRTGVALSFSSPDTGNLSNFLSPSSLHSELIDSGPPSLPFDLGETSCDEVERIAIGPMNIAAEIMEDLHELGVLNDCDVSQSDSETPCSKLEVIDVFRNHEVLNDDILMKNDDSLKEISTEKVICDKLEVEEPKKNISQDILLPILLESKTSDSDKLTPNFSLDELLISGNDSFSKNNSIELIEDSKNDKKLDDSEDWLKSVLLPLTKVSSDLIIESPKDIDHCLPVTVLPKESWPSCDELIPELVQVDKQQIQDQEEPKKPSQNIEQSNELVASQESDKKCKTLDLNSTLALSSPNFPFGPDSNSSMVSSFSSTPTFDTTKSLADIQMSLSISSNDGEDMIKIVPSLRFLASEVLRINKKVLMPLPSSSSLVDDTVQSKRMNSLTLALDTTEVQSKAPMPSPEDADKGTWRPTINQLLDLTSQNDHDLEGDDLMTTSFIERDCEGDQYTPDWESDVSDAESEDHSSSSGEFIWKDGDREESIKAKMATASYEEPQDDVNEKGMERIDEEDEEEEDEIADDSSCASATEFVPSTWDHDATPSKSALRTPDKRQDSMKRVCFKKQKYHCVYEYPREPSESEDDDLESPTRSTWQSTDTQNYDCFADWDFGDCELDLEATGDADSQEGLQPRCSKIKSNLHHPDVDIYRLSGFDYDLAQMTTDDGEFFISSSARPFHQLGSSSEFFPGRLQQSLDQPFSDQSQSKSLIDPKENNLISNTCENFIENERKVYDEQLAVGGLRHTREWLKLDLPNPAGECTSAPVVASNLTTDKFTPDTTVLDVPTDLKSSPDAKITNVHADSTNNKSATVTTSAPETVIATCASTHECRSSPSSLYDESTSKTETAVSDVSGVPTVSENSVVPISSPVIVTSEEEKSSV